MSPFNKAGVGGVSSEDDINFLSSCCCDDDDDDWIVTSPRPGDSNDSSLLTDAGVAADDDGGRFGLKGVADEGNGVIVDDDIIGSFLFDFEDVFAFLEK